MSGFDSSAIDPNLLQGLGISQQTESKRKDSLGQEDFLKLMITQLRNQDPMKPMENGEFLGQIAQFGAVNGIQELQKAVEGMAASMQSNQALQAASLVGREAMMPSDYAHLGSGEDAAVRGGITVPPGAGEVLVGVYDPAGRLVSRMSLGTQPAGMTNFEWNGMTDAGDRAAPGYYQIRAEAISAGKTESLEVLVSAKVESVTLGGNGGNLSVNLAGLGEVNFSDLRHIA